MDCDCDTSRKTGWFDQQRLRTAFEASWPANLPFPPAYPWLAGVLTRSVASKLLFSPAPVVPKGAGSSSPPPASASRSECPEGYVNVIYYVQLSDTASAWCEEGGLALEIVEMLYYLLIDAYESVAVAYYESFCLGYDFRDCIQESVNIFYTEGSWDLPFGGGVEVVGAPASPIAAKRLSLLSQGGVQGTARGHSTRSTIPKRSKLNLHDDLRSTSTQRLYRVRAEIGRYGRESRYGRGRGCRPDMRESRQQRHRTRGHR